MNDYIDRVALKKRFQKRLIWLEKDVHDEYSKGLFHGCETDMSLIDEIPAANVVEVVRCKNCKYCDYKPSVIGCACFKDGLLRNMKENDFCSYGERREDNA